MLGSLSPISSVDPTISANRTVTTLRFAERLRLLEAIATGAAEPRGAKVGVLAIRTDDGKADAAGSADPVVRQRLHLTAPGKALTNP